MQMENFTQKVINVMKVARPNITRLIKAYTPRQGLSLHSKYSYAANSYSAIDYVLLNFMWSQFWMISLKTHGSDDTNLIIPLPPPSSPPSEQYMQEKTCKYVLHVLQSKHMEQ